MIVEIYGKDPCPNCTTAETLSAKANVEYKVLKVGKDFEIPELFEKVGSRVGEFPQVFVDGKYIGNISKYREFLKNLPTEEDSDLSDFEL